MGKFNTPPASLHVLLVVTLLAPTRAPAAPPTPPAPEMPVAPNGVRRWVIPTHAPLPPEPPGKPYKVPATNWELRPILWGWSCELPDGTGLQFGGVDQRADDGRGHTLVKAEGQWKPIVEDLRKANPLQKHHDALQSLRNACKDTLARARSLYFDGKTEDDETQILRADIDPALAQVSAEIAKSIAELTALTGLEADEAAQAKLATKRLETAATLIKPIAPRVTPDQLATLRNAQIELEFATEFLDAEPPPRALSLITWDARTKLYVLFGGDHADYRTNDLWVFDPARRKWTQRHPQAAPEPRADHHLDAPGDGRIIMYGGYTRRDGYVHLGPAKWVYDLAANAWTAQDHDEKLVEADIRSAGYAPPAFPESFMKGPRPDAAANEAKLKAIPANTWVKLQTPIPLGGRDWGTWVLDPDRDLYYVFAGGHASYSGNDVARYHLATNRWEITDPTELPLGGAGSNEQYPAGVNFNARPWCRNHVWNSQAYEPTLKKLVNVGVTMQKIDRHFYVYDPDKSDWTARHRVPDDLPNSTYSIQVRGTPHGLFAWSGDTAWLLDPATLQWKRLDITGTMPHTAVDSCGMAYDAKRDRMLLMTLNGYSKPYDGQIHALDLKTRQISPLNPDGMDASKSWRILLREAAFDPTADLMLLPQVLQRDRKILPDHTLAYDPDKNRWVLIATPNATGRPFNSESICTSLAYDPKRQLFWCGDSAWNGAVWILRLDPSTAQIKPLATARE